ncbi:unnamed protein product [Closterium sp. NIES-53]
MALSLVRNQALSTCLPAASHLSLLLLRALHRHTSPAGGAGAATRAPAHSAVSSSLPQPSRQTRSAHSGASGGIPPIPSFWSPSAESTTDSAALSALDSALLGNNGAASPVAWPSHSTAHATLLDNISQQLDATQHAATSAEPLNHPKQTAHLPESEALDSVLRMFSTPKPASPLSQSWDVDSPPARDASLNALSEYTLPGMPEQGWRASWGDEKRAGDSPRGRPVHDTPPPDFLAADTGAFYGGIRKARAMPFVSITAGVVFELDD